MLSLVGHQLLNENLIQDQLRASSILERLLQQNRSLVGSAFSDINGQILAASSNLNIKKIPNLKTSKNSRDSFLQALQREEMVVGKTYYFTPANSW